MVTDTDLILVGGGLANSLIALRLSEVQPKLRLLILEQEEKLGGNHTWSFHGSDLTADQLEWLRPLVQYNWDQTEVRFPHRERTLPGSYHSLTSERLHATVSNRLGDTVRTGMKVKSLSPSSVILEDGQRLSAQAVIDGRGPSPNPYLDVRFQKFVGLVLELEQPHELSGPIIMDATESQDDGYRFFYTLPFDAKTLLIEDTRYSDTPGISDEVYGDAIQAYAARQGWQVKQVLRKENGVLPITLGGDISAFWNSSAPIARSGLHAALFQPATGYSLPNAVRLADLLAGQAVWSSSAVYATTRKASLDLWHATGFYRVLNRMLFLAADSHERRHVLERFYGLNEDLIARFYAGHNTLVDKCRILIGKPPVKLNRAYRAVFRYRHSPAI
ncbi:MAG: lycopene beta-cyclase CrtY [Gammaproteobacteria bacterium]